MEDGFSVSRRGLTSVLIMVLVMTISAGAQFRAGIQGAVTDAQGAAIVGATVTLTNKETGRTIQTRSGDGGFYRFDNLAPGRYSVTTEMNGFKKKFLEQVEVKAEDIQGLNLELEPGNLTETITVSSQVTEQLQTESAAIDRAITKDEVLRLPQTGRDPYELVRLTPGVFGLGMRDGSGNSVHLPNSSGPGGSNSSIFQTENQVQISANGQRLESNNFQIDGVSVNSQAWGGAAVITPNQESVKEVRVVANSYSAENGRNSGALVEVVSQNGTNDLHGSAFFKYNDPALNAFNQWGGPNGGDPKRQEQRFRQWGGSFGGPVYLPRIFNGKNRLFFFFSFERLSNNTDNFNNQWVETPEFRQLLQNARPNSLANQIVNMPGMQPRVLNVIPNSCAAAFNSPIDSTLCHEVAGGLDIGSPAGALGQRVPGQAGGGLDGIPDIQYAQIAEPGRNLAQQFNGRVDYQARPNDLIAFSFFYTPNDSYSTGTQLSRPITDWLSARRNSSAALIWTHTFSSTLLNEARFNFTRWYFNEFESNSNMPWQIPHVIVGDFLSQPIDWSVPGPGVFYQTTYNFRDSLSKVVGSHGLKFGGEVSREQNNDTVASAFRPEFNFGTLWNFANDAPIRETGNFDPRTGLPTELKKYIRASTFAAFVQDDWKVRPNLTLNLGLRWEYWQPLHEKYGDLSKFVFGPPGDLLQGGSFVLGEPLHNPDYNNFGPQFGFAWSPARFKSKGVVRGGFGIGYDRVPYSITLNGRMNPPLVGMFTLSDPQNILYSFGSIPNSPNGYPSNPSTILQIDPATNIPINLPSTTGKPDATLVTNPDVPNPYTYRYSLDVQYELAGNWLVSLGYQGSTSHKYPRLVNLNYNDWGVVGDPATFALHNVSYMLTDVNANYNAMLARVSRRFGNGFNFEAQYRWSKSIDTCSDDQSCKQSYPFDQSLERGPSDFDVTHSFVASGLWDLPIFRTRKDVLGKVAGGWQLNGILTASSGFPWTPVFDPGNCTDLNNAGWQCPQRPSAYLGNLSQNTSNGAFMSSGGTFGTGAAQSFVSPTFGTFAPVPGIGRNVFRGPNYFSVDLSTVKRFRLPKFFGENSGLDIRANFLNAFNNLNLKPFEFNTDSTKVNNVNFGKALEALSGRVIEFQARFFF